LTCSGFVVKTSDGYSVESEAHGTPVRYLKGIGERRGQLLAGLGIKTVLDLLFVFPRTYEDRSRLVPIGEAEIGNEVTLSGRIVGVKYQRAWGARRKARLEVYVEDDTGMICAVWFNAYKNLVEKFKDGENITLFGKVGFYRQLQMINPDYCLGDAADMEGFGRIVPVYPATEGISQHVMRAATRQALDGFAARLPDIFPPEYLRRKQFPGIGPALSQIHFPPDQESLEAAKRRMAFEELLVFQTAVAIQRRRVKESPGLSFRIGPNVDSRIRRLFDFNFTGAQEKVVREISEDMRSPQPMHRLLQGDVGCGKTAVAIYAILAALADRRRHYQAAFMAPTEILAEQHFLTVSDMLKHADINILLLRGKMKQSERNRALQRIRTGEAQLIVGTHALIQKDVEFRNLAFVVIDEQHRFGVRQRMAIRGKGTVPDVLIMTATPIPRSLSLIYFGDLDVSVIDEMPPGRQQIKTGVFMPGLWKSAYSFAGKQLEAGRQVYVVFPLVEDSDKLVDLTSATEGFKKLSQGQFSGFECGLLHGQMPQEEKRKKMEDFRSGRYRCLIATTVIEVGIDVPNATVMIIQHAERLGLSQLHQLRGRIGRGEHESHCLLLVGPCGEDARKRLDTVKSTTDGFKVAEEDLRLRGPGEFFGTRQSGMPDLNLLDYSLDTRLLDVARKEAFTLVSADPDLSADSHQALRQRILERFGDRLALSSMG